MRRGEKRKGDKMTVDESRGKGRKGDKTLGEQDGMFERREIRNKDMGRREKSREERRL